MKTTDIDWHYIKRSSLIFLATLVAALSIWGLVFWKSHAYYKDYTSVENKIRQKKNSIRTLKSNINLIKINQAVYWHLSQRQAINQEHRLQWINQYRLASQKLKLHDARYKILPQVTSSEITLSGHHNVKLRKSQMKITLQVLHEADLLRLFAQLDKAPGVYHASSCELSQLKKSIKPDPDQKNFSVACDLDWFTFMVKLNPSAPGRNNVAEH